jgi:torulene dioxygenase
MLDALGEFDASKPTKWYVVDRKLGKGVVAKYESNPFFCFHTINAWEEPRSSDP